MKRVRPQFHSAFSPKLYSLPKHEAFNIGIAAEYILAIPTIRLQKDRSMTLDFRELAFVLCYFDMLLGDIGNLKIRMNVKAIAGATYTQWNAHHTAPIK